MSDNTTLIDNLNSIKNSKADIKQALIDKGQQATDVLDTYAGLIEDIETGIDTSDATATASDIKEGKTAYVDGEKITGIYVDEDLTDVLDAQDQKIAELEQSLENKTAGGGKPNIFVQLEEPEVKKGIWLKTDKTMEHIYADDDIFIAGEWKPDGAYKNIPYSFYSGAAVAVGTDIYLFGGPYNTYTYKYNTLTDTYTKMKNIPYDFYQGSAVVIGTDVYLFGTYAGSNNKYAYKYNTLTNTYTRLTDVPNYFYQGSAVAVGTNIYLFGTGSSSYSKYAYKYNTLTNTYTGLANMPNQNGFYGGSAAAIGTDIYLFGGTDNTFYDKYAYKYNTLTDTYTRLTDIPYDFYYGSTVAIGTNIYLFGSSVGTSKQYTYEYNTLTNTYTKLKNIPYGFHNSSAVRVDTGVYLLGGSPTPNKIQVYSIEDSTYENNTLVIAQGRYYKSDYGIELYNDDLFSTPMLYAFADAWFYTTEDGIITTIPTYYGDGTEWIKFKN